jgi:hypothetical protein
VLVDRQRRVLYEVVGAVKHEPAAGLDRPPRWTVIRLTGSGRRILIAARDDVELHQELAERDLRRRSVDGYAIAPSDECAQI